MMLRMEMHLHTRYSRDSLLTLNTIIRTCQSKGINCVAVTDHGTIQGAKRLREKIKEQKLAIKVIIGEEISTSQGEIIGLFLKEKIPNWLPLKEAIRRIREQGGLVYVPHPFIFIAGNSLGKELYSVSEELDIIETLNARAIFRAGAQRARRFARDKRIISAVGSDAHSRSEIGNAYMELEDFNSQEDFLRNLREGRAVIKRGSWPLNFVSLGILFLNKITGKKLKDD